MNRRSEPPNKVAEVGAQPGKHLPTVILLALAMTLGLWGLVQERRGETMPELAVNPWRKQ